MFDHLYRVHPARSTRRVSSWDVTAGNEDFWQVPPGETRVLASIDGPGIITHLWSCFAAPWRDLRLQFTWDGAPGPSIDVPFGDFFGLGHGIVNSHQSFLFSTSTNYKNTFNNWCAHNCYVPMPFKQHATVALVNESPAEVMIWFYVDHEIVPLEDVAGAAYFHASFRRELPFGGWGGELAVNSPEVDGVRNLGRDAWDNNHVILDAMGTGQYIGCTVSITNLHGRPGASGYGQPGYSWWGEGDDMIWVDGFKWPPDLHGTGTEDYFNHGMGMQPVAFMRNGSSLYEFETGGYATCYVFHLENPVRFTREIKVTIEVGHANHLINEVSSVAYWYATEPATVPAPPPVACRRAVPLAGGAWNPGNAPRHATRAVPVTAGMQRAINDGKRAALAPHEKTTGVLAVPADGSGAVIGATHAFLGQAGSLDIPLAEILGEHLPVTARVEIEDETMTGMLDIDDHGHLVLARGLDDPERVDVDAWLRPLSGKRVKLVFGRLVDGERDPGCNARHLLRVTTRLSFRD